MHVRSKIGWLRDQYGETAKAFKKTTNTRNNMRDTEICWRKPKARVTTLNVETSVCRDQGTSACGDVRHDCLGNWFGGFVGNKNYGDVDTTESWAILEGLEFAWKKGF